MTGLIIFEFETGDSTCPYWAEPAVVNIKETSCLNAYSQIDDCISSYVDTPAADDKSYGEIAADILDSFDFEWKEFLGKATIEFCLVFHI